MDMGVAKSADGAQAPVDSTFDEINRMFSKLGFIDYNSRLAQGPFYSPNLICLSHASRRRGGAFSRESIPVLLVRIPTCLMHGALPLSKLQNHSIFETEWE